MGAYVRFCSSQYTAAGLLQKLVEIKPGFDEFLRQCQSGPKIKGMPLSFFLLKVGKSQKQLFLSSILPKNEWKGSPKKLQKWSFIFQMLIPFLPTSSLMPCPVTGPKMFCADPNILSQTKNLNAFSASSKTFVPAQKPIFWMQIIFLLFVTHTIWK